jgi:colicin import membrane protein
MPAATDRIEFVPPPQPGRWPALALALLAHLLLMVALTWGITWNREPQDMSAEAELWTAVPQQAAPREVAPPPPPVVQAPPLQAPPPPPPAPEPKVEPPAPPVPAKDPDIAIQQEKRKQEEAERRRLELERQKLEVRKRQEEAERQKKLEARREQEEAAKREVAERKAAAEKQRREDEAKAAKAKARQQEDAKRMEALRQENLRRMQGMANATGEEGSTGKAARSEGPSSSYAGRIRARVRPNIVFTDDVSGNPTAEVEVRMAPDGTIVSKRVVKPSGVRSWDEAVLRALDKTEVLPRDVDGRVHSPLIIAFRLRD